MSSPNRHTKLLLRSVMVLSLLGMSAGACDCGSDPVKPCDSSSPPAACGAACDGDASCTEGTYCGSDGTCTADCLPNDGNCGAGEVCDPTDGRCVDAPDAGAGGGTGGGGGNTCQELSVTADPVEPYIVFVVDRSTSMTDPYPYASSGNGSDCGTASPGCLERWESLQAVLLGGDSIVGQTVPSPLQGAGVIAPFAPYAHIGVVQYTGIRSGGSISGAWPRLIETPAALNNLAAIEADYTAPPGSGYTPTGESLWTVLCHLDAPYTMVAGDPGASSSPGCDSFVDNTSASSGSFPPDPSAPLLPADRDPGAPVILILATDGAPNSSISSSIDFCTTATRTARQWVLDAAKEALGENILTYVISVVDDADMNLHLEQVACEGGTGPAVSVTSEPCGGGSTEPTCSTSGNADGPGLIEAFDTTKLNSEITKILGSSIPCSFAVSPRIDPSTVAAARASATVTVDGAPVSQAPSATTGSGWWLSDDGTTFSLVGGACDSFRSDPGAQLAATFPCDSGVILIPQ